MTTPHSVRSRAAIRRGKLRAGGIARGQWPQWAVAVFSAVVSLAVAGIGGALALSGTYFGADEDRARESREKRAEVYADYLASVRVYADKYEQLKRGETGTPAALAARESYRAMKEVLDLVYIYGSDEGWAVSKGLDTQLEKWVARHGQADEWYPTELIKAYEDFQNMFCREASANPRPGCTAP